MGINKIFISYIIFHFHFIFTFTLYAQTFSWATSIGGMEKDYLTAIANDNQGNLILGGFYYSSYLTMGSKVLYDPHGDADIFLCKYGSEGLEWAINGGASGYDVLKDICTDKDGNIYITGYYQVENFKFGGQGIPGKGMFNIFISKIDQYGNVVWLKSIIGNKIDNSRAITIHNDQIFINGEFTSDTLITNVIHFIITILKLSTF